MKWGKFQRWLLDPVGGAINVELNKERFGVKNSSKQKNKTQFNRFQSKGPSSSLKEGVWVLSSQPNGLNEAVVFVGQPSVSQLVRESEYDGKHHFLVSFTL